jgi:hypothetical protein
MKEKYLNEKSKLFTLMDYAKSYVNDYVEEPLFIIDKLYELNNFITIELAQMIETQIYILEKYKKKILIFFIKGVNKPFYLLYNNIK